MKFIIENGEGTISKPCEKAFKDDDGNWAVEVENLQELVALTAELEGEFIVKNYDNTPTIFYGYDFVE